MRKNAPSVRFADSSPALRWSTFARSSSTAQRGRWIGAKRRDGGGVAPHRTLQALIAILAVLATPVPAFAWGSSGHRMVGEIAVRALPGETPAFLRTRAAALAVGELSREPDRSRDAGEIHDADRDPGHFLDVSDDGSVMGGPRLDALPKTRAAYEAALRTAGTDSWQAGYLPYAIVDRWQQLRKDFAYWRVLSAAERNPAWARNRAWFALDRARREAQILEHVGELSHFVGDGAQPLHVTMHFNGWGDYPNPRGYSQQKLHGPFEGALVRARVRPQAAAARLAPLRLCECSIEQRTAQYLEATSRLVIPFYELEKDGGLTDGDPRGAAFARDQLARGASELRDQIVEAWRASADQAVGWKPVRPADVAAGRVDPFPALYGSD